MKINKLKVIGISGKIGVGKTALSLLLLDMLPGWQRASFGDLLKQEVAGKFGIPLEDCFTDKYKLVGLTTKREKAGLPRAMTVRELLQWYGTDVVRAKDKDYWVKAMKTAFQTMQGKIPGVIVDDVRFANEASLIKISGGLLVRLEAYPGYAMPPEIAGHASETALDGYKRFDLVFAPEYGQEHLKAVAAAIVREYA